MNAPLRVILRMAERLETEAPALVRRRGDLRGEIAALEILLEAALAKNGSAPGKPVYRRSAESLLVERVATRLGLHQPSSADAVAGDLGEPGSAVLAVLQDNSPRRFELGRGGWRLVSRHAPQ